MKARERSGNSAITIDFVPSGELGPVSFRFFLVFAQYREEDVVPAVSRVCTAPAFCGAK